VIVVRTRRRFDLIAIEVEQEDQIVSLLSIASGTLFEPSDRDVHRDQPLVVLPNEERV
jgi:hypothetical protein